MKKIKMALLAVLGAALLTGCGAIEQEPQKVEDLDYTLVAEADIPQELLTQIDAAKTQEMKLTFFDGECLYLVKGYGEQPAGSSIQVLELYQAEDGIVFDTQLLGGGQNEESETTSAYPYIVVKVQSGEQNVVFQ